MDNELKERSIEIGKTIMQQINYNRLKVMVGGWVPAIGNNEEGAFFCFRFKARSTVNFCRITLRADDTYNMYFCKIHGIRLLHEKTFEMVYFDQLLRIFESHTKLATNL